MMPLFFALSLLYQYVSNDYLIKIGLEGDGFTCLIKWSMYIWNSSLVIYSDLFPAPLHSGDSSRTK